MNADVIPPLPLRRGAATAGGVAFVPSLLLRRACRDHGAAVVLHLTGAPGESQCRFDDAAGRELARAAVADGTPALVEVPRGAARLVVEGPGEALATARLGFFPIRGQFPLGRLLLKLHTFARARLAPRKGAKGLIGRWHAASDAARHVGLQHVARLASSPLQREIGRRDYLAFRERFVEDFAEVPPVDAAPRLCFITVCDLDAPSNDSLQACADALRAQGDTAFDWVLAVPQTRLARQEAALADLVTGLGRIVPFTGCPADGLNAALDTLDDPDALVCVLDGTGRPTRDAVALVRAAFAAYPDLMLLYTDEERCDDDGRPLEPVFKPAFNRHLLEAWPYFGALTVLRAGRAQATGLNATFGAAAFYDFLLRYLDGLPADGVRHLPRIAYAGPDAAPGFADPVTAERAATALATHLGIPVAVSADGRFLRPLFPTPEEQPLVSIVIPTRDRADLMGMTLRTLVAKTNYRNFEIIIVDNGSVEPETFALFEEIKAAWPRTRVVRDDGDFNFPRICNSGVDVSEGSLILLLNNDIEVIDGTWLDEMVALISRRDHGVRTGVVGAKLLYPDRSIQHGGVMVGLFGYASHWFAHCLRETPGYEARLLVRQNLSAVTAACLLIRRDVWDEIGPLDAVRFAEDCNDIDLCLRARRAGYGVVFTPYALLIHHESASRGKKRNKAHRERLKAQHARMEEAWHTSVLVDPHHSPNLDRKNLYGAIARAPKDDRAPRTDALT